MTVYTIEAVKALIEEIQADGGKVACVFEYVNAGNGKTMFAVFTKACFCDIFESPYVKNPKLIWLNGKFFGKYERLN